MLSFFNLKKDSFTPKRRGAYAVVAGDYVGEFLVFMESAKCDHIFLSLPKMIIRKVPLNAFKRGLKDSIIDLVKVLPSNVFSVCRAQYFKLKDIR
jgi:hypothetical protein